MLRRLALVALRLVYPIVKYIVFRRDAEQVHNQAVQALNGKSATILKAAPQPYRPVEVLGIPFAHPLGLAAGFFKNPADLGGLRATQFSFAEVGSITAHAQQGNPLPRLFRFPNEKILLNRMGFNNIGAFDAAVVLENIRRTKSLDRPLFVNIGKSKIAASANEAIEDITSSYQTLHHYADAVVINLSSPNTPGLRGLMTTQFLDSLWEGLDASNRTQPLLLKLHADLLPEEFEELLDWTKRSAIDGLVCSNTTVRRDGICSVVCSLDDTVGAAGGISGAPVFGLSLPMVAEIRKALRDDQIIIGCGGILGVEEAQAYLAAGASLIEAYTGWVYGGPGWEERTAKKLL